MRDAARTPPHICLLSAATFNSAKFYNRRSTLYSGIEDICGEKRERKRERIESKLVRRYEHGTWCILRPLFTSARGILYYTFVLFFALSPIPHPRSLSFSSSCSSPCRYLPPTAIRSSPTLDCMHIRSTSPNRIMVISLSHRASSRLSNAAMYAHPQHRFSIPFILACCTAT